MAKSSNKRAEASVTTKLIEAVKSLSPGQQKSLFKQIQERQRNAQNERRILSRKSTPILSDYAVDDLAYRDTITNISSGGVFIQTSMSFSVKQPIILTFSFPGDDLPIKISGEIIRKEEKGIGVRFTRTNQRLATLLKTL